MNKETFASSEATFASSDEQYRNVPLKKVVRMFATFCWLHELKIGLNVEIMEVPQAIERVESWNKTSIQRRWKTYQSGEHRPVTWVLDLAEQHVPGSKAIFQHSLWNAIRLDKSAAKIARELLGTTLREGDELIQWMLDHQRSSKSHNWLRKRCKALVAKGSLEGLAVLTVCMRLASKAEPQPLALTFYLHATNCLIILGIWFNQHGIAKAIAEYYEKTLLPACYRRYQSGKFSSNDYLFTINSLFKAVSDTQEKAGRELTHEEKISVIFKVLVWYPPKPSRNERRTGP